MRILFLLTFFSLSFFITQHAFAQCNGAPTVDDTESIASITTTTATLGSDVTNDGAGTCIVSGRGIKWSTVSVADAISNGTQVAAASAGEGAYTVAVSGLPAGTQIFFVGYATNSNSTGYSNGASFYTTATEPGASGPLTATTQADDQINLSFAAGSTLSPAASGYIIYRNAGSAPSVGALADRAAAPTSGDYEANISSSATTSYASTGLTAQTRYYFSIVPYAWNSNSATSYNFNISGAASANAWTFSVEPDNQPNAAMTATASSPTNINLAFAPANGDGVNNDDGFIILRTLSANPDVSLLQDGVAPSSQSNFLTDISVNTTNSYADASVGPNTTYYYAIIPYNWDGTNPETYNYRKTAGGNPIRYANATTPTTTVTLTGFNTGGSNGLSTTFLGGTNDTAIIGFSINSTNGPATLTSVGVRITTGDPASVYTNFELFKSTDNTFDGGDLSMGTATPTGAGPYTLTFPVSQAMATNTAQYYFLIADLPTSSNPASNHVFAIANTDFAVTNGTVSASSFTRDITAVKLEANITANAGAAANVTGSHTDQKILAATIASNGTQTLQKLVFGFDVDVATTLNTSSFLLKIAGTPVSGATYNYDGTAKTLTVGSINTSINSAVNFDLHVDVLASASTGFTVNLNNTNNPQDNSISNVNQGFVKTFVAVTNTVSITALEANFVSNPGAAATIIGGSLDNKILSITASSNGTQELQTLIFTFDVDVATTLNTGSLSLKIAGTPVSGATYNYDGTAKTLTVDNINTDITNDVNFDLHANVLTAATTGFTVSLTDTENPTNNSAGTVDQGLVNNFGTVSNAVAVAPLEADFASNAGAAATIIGGSSNQKILALTAISNGTQTLQKLVFKFSTDVTTTLNTSTFALKIGGTNVSGASYNYDGPSQTLTVSSINTDITNDVNFDLHANVLTSATTGFTVSLRVTENPTDNSASTVDVGFVKNFTTVSNAVAVALLETDFASNAGAAATVLGGSTNQNILAITAISNGTQTLQKLIFKFDVDVATTLNTTSFALKIGGTPVSGANYSYDGTGKTLTVTSINTDITSDVNFDLHANVLSNATTGFTVSLAVAENPTDNSVNTVDVGFVKNFTTVSNLVGITLLETDFASNAGAAATVVGGDANQKVLALTAISNGVQTLQKLVFKFDVNVATTLNTSSFLLKIAGTPVSGATYNYDGTAMTLTVGSINTDITNDVNFDLHANVLQNATTGFTVSLAVAENPTNNSVNTVDVGYVKNFTTVSNTVAITLLEADFASNAGATNSVVGGDLNQKVLALTAISNGTQSLQKLVFKFDVDVATLVNTAAFKLKIGGTDVSGAGYSYDGPSKTLTVSSINTDITTDVNFDLHADFLGNTTTGFTVSLAVADNPMNNSIGTVDGGYVKNFTTVSNTVAVTQLEADFVDNTGGPPVTNVVATDANQKILAITASSNGNQKVQKLVFAFDIDVATIVNTSAMRLKIGGVNVAGAGYSYDGTAKTLTVSSINTSLATADVNFDLHADFLATAASGFTVSLASADNPTNNSIGTVDFGVVNNFTTITNTIAVTSLEADFVVNAGGAGVANVVGGDPNQKILAITASSNGVQILQKLIYTFDVDVAASVNTTTFALKVAGVPVGSAIYNYDGPTKTLTVSSINTNITSDVNFDLHVNVLPLATAGFTVNLTNTENPSNNSAGTVDVGLVNNFTTISNTITVTPLEADFVANGGGAPVNSVIGGNTNQKILAITASSNGIQILEKLVFKFNTDIASTINTTSFALKIAGVPVATASYNYDSPSQTLTVSSIDTDITADKNFDLHADILTTATTGFTVNLASTENPTDNSASTTDVGYINNFTTISNSVTVTILEADFVSNAGAVVGVTGGDLNQKILALTASSNGVQSLQKLIFKFSTDVSSTVNTSTFALKIGGVAVGSASYNYSAGTQTLTVSTINTDITADKNFDLHVDFLTSATTGFTIDLTSVDNPTNNSASTVDAGFVNNFTTISNTVGVTLLETDFVANAGAVASVVGGNSNYKILALTASSNGVQTLEKLIFAFNVDIASTINTSTFALKVGGVAVGTALYSYDSPTRKLTVSNIGTDITSDVNFDLHADILATGTTNFTVSVTSADNPTNNGAGTSDAGYINNFATISNAVTVNALQASLVSNAGAVTTAVGGNNARKILAFTGSTTAGGSQAIDKLIFSFSVDVATQLTGFALKNGSGTTIGTASYNSGTQKLTVSGIGEDISTSENFDLFADVPDTAPTGSFTVSLSNADNPANNSASTVNRGYVATFTTISNTVTITGLTATIAQVTGGTVLVASSTLEAGTSNRPLYAFSISSNGAQTLTNVTLHFLNQPNGLTNFRLFKGTSGAVGAQVATAADPGGNSITFTLSEALPPTLSDDYYYLVANVLSTANISNTNNITISLDPTTTDITVTPGNKSSTAFSGSSYVFRSSASLTVNNNEGETSPINYAIYSTKTAASGLTTANAQKLYSITIGGNDSDSQPINITRVRFDVNDIRNIAALALVDPAGGNVTLAEVDASAYSADPQTIDFGNGVATLLSIPDATTDAGTYTLDVYGTFRSTVIDNDEIIFTFNSITTDGIQSSISTGQGTFSSDAGENNITVVATQQIVATLSTGLAPIIKANPNSDFIVRARATDALFNIDADKTGTATFDALSPATENIAPSATQSWTSGEISWTISLAPAGTYTLEVDDSGPLTTVSFPFTIESLGTTITTADLQSCKVGSGAFYVALPDLVILESDQADFSPGTNLTFLLILPDGWEFMPTTATGYVAPTISYTASQNFTAATFNNFIGTSIAKFTYSVTGTNKIDQMTISGLKVKNVSAGTAGDITRSGTGVIVGVDESESLGVLDLPGTLPTVDIKVEAQPGNNYIDPNTDRFGVGDVAVILNGEVGGAPIAMADQVFSGNGVSLKAIGAPINADRYVFNPTTVNAAFHDITLNYTNPTNGCKLTKTESFRVQNLAIVGLQDEFCNNDVVVKNLSVNPIDIPGGYDLYDFVYYDYDFASVSYPLTNNPSDVNTTGVRFYDSNVPTTLTGVVTKYITGITVNPYSMINGVYDYYGYYGGGYKSIPISNPVVNAYLVAYTSFVRLTIPSHGYSVGDRIFINGYLDYIYPYVGYNEFTVHQVIGVNDIIINLAETFGYDHNVDYGYSEYYMYYNAPYNIQVNSKQSLDTKFDLRIPGHGFVTGDRVQISGFHNFSPYFNYNTFTVTKLDANYVQIDVKEIYGGGLTGISGTWYGETFYTTADPFIPLPGYIHDMTVPFPHKGAPRETTTNSQFKPSSFSTGWNDAYVYVYDRVLPSACAGVTGTPGCSVFPYHSVPVQLVAPPSVDFSGLNTDYCAVAPGAPITLTGNQLDGSFSITGNIGLTDNGANNPTATFNPVAGGIAENTALTVTYTFTSGCTGTATKQVTVHSLPIVDAGLDADLCVGNSIILGAATVATGNGPFSYSWNNVADLDNPGLSNPKATPTVNRTYTVTVTDAYNCTNDDAIAITTFNPIVVNAIAPSAICGSDIANGIAIGTSSIVGTAIGTWSTTALGDFKAGNTIDNNYGSTDTFFPTAVSGTVTLTLTSEDPAGPCPAAFDDVIVDINPSAQVATGGPYEYCATSTNMQVNGVVTLDGSPYTNVTWTENGAGSMASSGLAVTSYVPTAGELANGATISLTLTALDSDGGEPCLDVDQNVTLVIAPRPIANAGPDMTICASDVFENSAVVTLAGVTTLPGGSITGSWSGGTGSFAGGGTSESSSYTPNSSTLTTTLVETLTLTTADPASVCGPESDQMTVTTYAVPPAPLATQPAQVCVGVAVPTLEAQGNGLTWYTAIDNTKTYTKAPSGFAGVGSPINTGLTSTSDLVKNYYVIQSANGCPSPPATVTVVINPLPVPDFTMANFCLGDFTLFTDQSTLTYTNGRSGTINGWSWDMKADNFTPSGPGNNTITGRTDSKGTFKNPEHIFSAPGSYDVEMTVVTSDGCSSTIAASASSFGKALEIGALPKANFIHSAICSGDNTQFTYLDGDNPADNRTTGFSWTFGDASPASILEDPAHQFATNGTYNVTLTLTTDLNCQASKTKSVFILPYVTDLTNGYFQDFESPSSTGWVHEGLAFDFLSNSVPDSWQVVDLTSTSIALPTNGTYAFVTSAQSGTLPTTRSYGTNERSVLYPPCVDLTTLPRPALSFDYWRDMDDKDGVYVEVSTDNGASWQRLGNGVDPNWYSAGSISGLSSQQDVVYSSSQGNKSVGQPIDQFGFSGTPTEATIDDQWRSAKFSLDGYATQSKLRLRFVFGSNGDISDKMGFVMDNFKLGSRNRKVLVENFTNSTQTSNNAIFNTFKAGLINTEVVKLQYHSSLLGEDNNNLMNPIDLNARAAFYGLTNQTTVIPRAFIDGKTLAEGYFTANPTPWAENLFSSQALSVAPLAITLNTVDGADEELKTTVSITANEIISIGKPVLIVAVVEKVVGSDQYVVRKLLPSASGYPLTMPINQGVLTPTPLAFSWFVDIEGIDVTQLAVVAFVQDLESKDVLQAEVDFNPLNLPKAVTGIGEVDADEHFNVYPNPADKELIVELPQAAQARIEMQLLDQMGKRVEQSFFEKGIRNKTITTSGLAGGVYFIQVNSPKGLLMKKVVITHSH